MAKRYRTFASIDRAELIRTLTNTDQPHPQPVTDADQIDAEDILAGAIIIRKAKPTAHSGSVDPKANQNDEG
jgi:hypothetical protein